MACMLNTKLYIWDKMCRKTSDQISDQQIIIFPANQNRNRFA